MNVACYCRVSTQDQNLERQVKSTEEYAQERLGADDGDLMLFRDKTTGTDTNRAQYTEMMESLDSLDAVVVHSVSRISRSIRDLDRTVERITDSNAEFHVVSENLQFVPGESDPYQKAMMQLLGVFAEFEADMIRNRVKEGIAMRKENEDYHHGPAPLGFIKNDGHLIEAENFDRVRTVLEMVDDGDMSKRKAARELDSSRRTIGRALDRKHLYGLE